MARIRVSRLSTECDVYEPEDFEPEDSCWPHPEAHIEIIAQIESHTYYKLLRHPLHHLTHPSTSSSLIANILSAAAVPLPAQPAAVRTIGDRVRAIAARPHNKNRKTVPVVVTLSVQVESRTSTQPLLIEEEEVVDLECAICMEEMVVAARLPCSHLFHGSCIARWLDDSDHCPLCRSQLSAL